MTLIRQARFVKLPALLSLRGFENLLETLSPLAIARTGAVLPQEEIFLDKEKLIANYAIYIEALERGEEPGAEIRPFFSTTLGWDRSSFSLEPARPGTWIARASQPAIQMRYHVLAYSPIDHSFHSMALGKETIPWGIEFSFAGLVQRGTQVEEVDRNSPNAKLFRTLQKWLRAQTRPVLFRGDGWERRTHFRLSPECTSWINHHPSLEGLEVA